MCGVPHQSRRAPRRQARGRRAARSPSATRWRTRAPRRVSCAATSRGSSRPAPCSTRSPSCPSAPSYLAALCPGEAEWGVAFLDLSTGRFHAGVVPAAARRGRRWRSSGRGRSCFPTALPAPGFRRRSPAGTRPGGGAAAARARPLATPGRARPPRPLRLRARRCGRAGSARRDRRRRSPSDRAWASTPSAVATLELFESSDGSTRAEPLRPARPDAHAARRPRAAARRWRTRRSTRSSSRRAGTRSRSSSRRADVAEALQAALDDVGDLERRFARVAVGTAGPREVAALAAGLKAAPAGGRGGRRAFRRVASARFSSRSRTPADCVARIEATLSPEPPVLASAGGVIRDGADAELDELRTLRRDAQGALLAVEAEERRRSGISSVRVKFNRVFGYSLEVGNAHRDQVPSDWIRRAVAGQRRALRHAGAQGARGEDPRRRGPHRRDRGPPLPRAARRFLSTAGDRVRRTAAATRRARPLRLPGGDGALGALGPADALGDAAPVDRRRAAIRSSSGSGGRSRSSPTTRTSTPSGASRSSRGRTWAASRRTCARSRRSCCSPRPGSFVPADARRALDRATASSPAWARPTTSRAASPPSWSRCSSRPRSCGRRRRAAS